MNKSVSVKSKAQNRITENDNDCRTNLRANADTPWYTEKYSIVPIKKEFKGALSSFLISNVVAIEKSMW